MRALLAGFSLIVSFLVGGQAWGQTPAAAVAKVTHLSGTLSAKRADGSSKLLSVKSDILSGDQLNTEAETYARIKFQDGGEVVLRPNSQFRIDQYVFQDNKPETDNLAVSLLKGGMRAVTGLLGKRNPEKVNVSTATATIGIRGTHFGLLFCSDDCAAIPSVSGEAPANGLHIDVAQGTIIVSNSAGRQEFAAGQFGYVQNATTPPVAIPPSQGIRVTMPAAISKNNTGGKTLGADGGSACGVK